ncbi:MAG: hypothetical protein WBQ73_00245, partial [Candidatus Babeliales bacterium]
MQKIMKILISLTICVFTVHAKMVHFQEDVFLSQAPQDIVAIAEKVAKKMGYDGTYEVVIPKKAAIELNPWNKFASYGVNQQTKNNILVINQDWLLNLSEEEQEFILGRYFMFFEKNRLLVGTHIATSVVVPIALYAACRILNLIELKQWHNQWHKWCNIMIFAACGGVCTVFIKKYMNSWYENKINRLVLDKTSNKDAAISA